MSQETRNMTFYKFPAAVEIHCACRSKDHCYEYAVTEIVRLLAKANITVGVKSSPIGGNPFHIYIGTPDTTMPSVPQLRSNLFPDA